ncbi:sulfide-dependent adenosine diphosphate thiazole synthase [Pseudothermotoga thermarum]|uniref:Thiamine thiazole synthase n=1 Tax=Pseudothermotoga thermarum DSM 5069 TaxID=688269 RepID=F7YUG6_9THEM|nr:sulfide-dependent adenosine diphosphate thiazole synthase [Pseudothermotoga thermarum]AEH51437.1 thiazole-adenylate synthase [Pseudothermotoga thermarum DSM 5069]
MKDIVISKLILDAFYKKLSQCLDLDVAIAGAGPSGLAMAYKLASEGLKVAIFEAKNAPGGGIWGGGMMFNEVVLEEELADFLDELGINYVKRDGFLVADAVHFASGLIYAATKKGAIVFNNVFVEDLAMRDRVVCGVVINWMPTIKEKLHVDPITVKAKYVVDGTGHPANLVRLLTKRGILNSVKGNTENLCSCGVVEYEFPMDAENGEKFVVQNTHEIYPGLIVIGMAAVSVGGGPRMGPIFGGMILSGLKAADMVIGLLKKEVVLK